MLHLFDGGEHVFTSEKSNLSFNLLICIHMFVMSIQFFSSWISDLAMFDYQVSKPTNELCIYIYIYRISSTGFWRCRQMMDLPDFPHFDVCETGGTPANKLPSKMMVNQWNGMIVRICSGTKLANQGLVRWRFPQMGAKSPQTMTRSIETMVTYFGIPHFEEHEKPEKKCTLYGNSYWNHEKPHFQKHEHMRF